MERRQRSCPVCRACLPGEVPGICLRLKAAVEAVAGDRVAARRSEVDQAVAQRRQRLRQQAAPAAAVAAGTSRSATAATSTASSGRSAAGDGGAARAIEAVAEALRREREQEERHWRCMERNQQLAAALPCLPPADLTHYPRERQAEETRWLAYSAGWPRTAALRHAANPALFARQLASAARPDGQDGQRELAQEMDVQITLLMVQQLPPGAAGLPGLPRQPAEVCCEESRWRYLQATGGGSIMAAAAAVAAAASTQLPAVPGGASPAFQMGWH